MGLFEEDEVYKRELKERKAKNAEFLGTWVTVMFWLQIVSIVADVLSSDAFEGIPVIYLTGTLLGYGIVIANSVILIKLKEVEDWFGKAGVCYLVSGLSGIVIAVLLLADASALSALLAIVVMFIQIKGNYNECTGYEVVLRGLDDELSGKWARQWKLEVICIVTALASSILLLVGTLLGGVVLAMLLGIAILGIAIWGFVLSILRMIYIYRTADIFRNYRPEETEVVENRDAF